MPIRNYNRPRLVHHVGEFQQSACLGRNRAPHDWRGRFPIASLRDSRKRTFIMQCGYDREAPIANVLQSARTVTIKAWIFFGITWPRQITFRPHTLAKGGPILPSSDVCAFAAAARVLREALVHLPSGCQGLGEAEAEIETRR